MISFFAILLLTIAGASAECVDTDRFICYLPLFNNAYIPDKETFCKQLPLIQECINKTNCPKKTFDDYVESLIQSCDTECDFYSAIKCSWPYMLPATNMTYCRGIEAITKCYSLNKCDQVVKENPTFFKICDHPTDMKDDSSSRKLGRKFFQKFKGMLALTKAQGSTTEKPTRK